MVGYRTIELSIIAGVFGKDMNNEIVVGYGIIELNIIAGVSAYDSFIFVIIPLFGNINATFQWAYFFIIII